VNGGLARSTGRRVIPSAGASSEMFVASRTHRQRRARTGARPRVTRDCHPAVSSSPKAVRRSRDRGCKGHRILRRAPTDRRHPGSSRGVGFHEQAPTVVSAVSASSDPYQPVQKAGVRPDCSAREGGRGARVKPGDCDRGARGSVASSAVGRKRPRSCLQAVRQ
jgi:hypothetical protein